MWQHFANSVFLANLVPYPVGVCAQARVQGGLRARPLAWVLVACLAAAQLLTTPNPARAQQQTINVLIDLSFAEPAKRFMEQIRTRLQPEARKAVRFEERFVQTHEIPKLLRESRWQMAILSTFALTNTPARTSAMAFEMPFIFSTMRSIISLQRSHLGQAGLSNMSEQGMTGFVYLNAGVTLVAGRGKPKSPDDLKGRKVAVVSPAEYQTLQKLGSSPVRLSSEAIASALKIGDIDSTVISSGNPATWALPETGFLLRDSVKAQVAVVVTHDVTWDRIPFVYRAMIGDAAIAASQDFDQMLLETENTLFSKARSSGLVLVNFQSADTSRATLQWITKQPEALRGIYSSVYNHITSSNPQNPRNPLGPRQGSQVGKLYFATTRDDTGHGTFSYRFGDSRTDVVKCGQIEYSLISPNQNTATFVGAVTADNDTCGTYLNAALASSKRTLIFVHGFNNRFSEAAVRAMMLKNTLGNDTEVVLWSWPSKRDALGQNYRYDKESAGGVALQRFKRLLTALKVGSENAPLNILGHSMGGWHTIGVLQGLANGNVWPALRNVVLAAPDVPSDEFGFALGDMRSVANRITLYACQWDWALMISEEWNSFPRAGTGGQQHILVSDKLESIDVEARLFSANHSYVFDAGEVLNDLTTLIRADTEAGGRGLIKKPKAPWHYWSFP